jgi:uncharacterized protein DUF2865
MISSWRETTRATVLVGLAVLAGASAAVAQAPGPAAGAASQNPVCVRLEGQLASIDRGTVDPARADQIKRYEDSSAKQQAELDRMSAQARRMGCTGGGFFSIFSGQNPQCTPLNQQIQQTRANLERMLSDLDRMQGGASGDREAQKQTVIAALAQNNCGPQYRAVANQQRGFFDTLFGGNQGSNESGSQGGGLFSSDSQSSTFRTVCVRTCDGFYYPISFSTTPARFQEDAQTCQQTCPAAEVVLMSHRNPGEDINRAVSISGAPYTSLPNAFKYRTEFNPSCSCRRAGQSWSDALSQVKDTTIQGGDIVVTEERAKNLSQPRDAKGRPIKPESRNVDPRAASAAAAAASAAAPGESVDSPDTPTPAPGAPKRTVRTVGPTYVPTAR